MTIRVKALYENSIHPWSISLGTPRTAYMRSSGRSHGLLLFARHFRISFGAVQQ